ncbi:hypothetical protein THYS13_07850 [Thermoanaerobacter sp. YS13]|uniref:four-carbon acid sugar kinase family protein n=1 Tax=Thermoanaerobacter sp. YS13 TaxID=1511746 RepID=UPI0005737467|nr:four-carbon acid sugar kinase family protein [Thermoanaerobacter sp. YS13]KHO62718.1 hypothetical protein THYS13_07850 [Thermoanaerobacter sp. YS13]
MPKILVIADDFTGANATGALLKESGFNSISLLSYRSIADCSIDKDVVCINTDTRAQEPSYAYETVKNVVNQFREKVDLISKRIDSTLRGNIGAEIDGVLDGLKQGYKAIVVVAYPSSGRISVGGYLLVNSIPLQRTGVSKDPKTPVKSSKIIDIIKGQSNKNIGYIYLEDVMKGYVVLSEKIANDLNEIIVIDAATDEDIDTIAKACILSKIPIVCIDPGPFTTAMAKNLLGQNYNEGKEHKILMIIGSTTDLTRKQIDYISKQRNILIWNVNIRNVIENLSEEITRIPYYIKNNKGNKYLCITTSLKSEDVLDLKLLSKQYNVSPNTISYKISDGLSKITKYILQNPIFKVSSVYVSGGDITQEFLKNINAVGIEIIEQVIPLAVHGKIIGGEFNGLNIITKGGLVGDEKTLDYIVSYIEKNIERRN